MWSRVEGDIGCDNNSYISRWLAVSGKGNCGHGCGKQHVAGSALRVFAMHACHLACKVIYQLGIT